MIISTVWNSLGTALLALTAQERWAATRKVHPRSAEEYSTILAIGLLLAALIIMLWWISRKRTSGPAVPARDLFSDAATRRGLDARERQMLQAIVARSGLERSHDIFITPDGFDEGAAKLLEECAQSRTPEEMERLRVEVAGLREKLAYRAIVKGAPTETPSSLNIPVGQTVELSRRRDGDSDERALWAHVIQNDALEIVVEMQVAVRVVPGDRWRVRYHHGSTIWEFDTITVRCEDRRLVLKHGRQVHVLEHTRPGPLAVQAPAVVAHFPFIQAPATPSGDMVPTDWFEMVRGVVTQVSDSTLEVRSPLEVQAGERVMVVFTLGPAAPGEAARDAEPREHVVSHIGRVKYRQSDGGKTVLTVALTDLTDRELDELMRLAQAAASDAPKPTDVSVMLGE